MANTESLQSMFAAKAKGQCPFCKKEGPFEFKDALSRKEFSMSGLCQPCQDEFFDAEPNTAEDPKAAFVAEHADGE